MTRYKLTIEYNGTNFIGWQKQKKGFSVQETIEIAAKNFLQNEIMLTVAGRTDAGVHAEAQVAHLDIKKNLKIKNILMGLNFYIAKEKYGEDISIKKVNKVGNDFNARFSAKSRTYRYQILNQAHSDPFLSRYTWHVYSPISIEKMNTAGQKLLGQHDFSSFCRKNIMEIDGQKVAASLIREIKTLHWEVPDKNLIELWVTANAFCHQMVRSITGTLVDIGVGKIDEFSILEILNARDRNMAGQVAPPHGLTLWDVNY